MVSTIAKLIIVVLLILTSSCATSQSTFEPASISTGRALSGRSVSQGEAEILLKFKLAASLLKQGRLVEAKEKAEELLDLEVGPQIKSLALIMLGDVLLRQGQLTAAQNKAEEAMALFTGIKVRILASKLQATVLHEQGVRLLRQGRFTEAQAKFERILGWGPSPLGPGPKWRSFALLSLSGALLGKGQLTAAQNKAEEAMALTTDVQIRREASLLIGLS